MKITTKTRTVNENRIQLESRLLAFGWKLFFTKTTAFGNESDPINLYHRAKGNECSKLGGLYQL
jgi:hypothetical protein